jgi:hypothetical protein
MMGETDALHFDPTGSSSHLDWQNFPPITLPFAFSKTTTRFIVTPSDRYTKMLNPDRAFPVGGISWETNTAGTSFTIRARNSDTAASGGDASFFWLVIDETKPPAAGAGIPLNQKLIGQPANFAATNDAGDHQILPNIFNPADQTTSQQSIETLLRINPSYSFVSTIGTTVVSTFGTGSFPALLPKPPSNGLSGRPLVFVTANNAGCGVGPNVPTHNAAAVALVVDQAPRGGTSPMMTPARFKLIARNADVAGTCGFNWLTLLPTTTSPVSGLANVQPGAPQLLDLLVDTGTYPAIAGADPFYFNRARTNGDWASAEVQFNAPFAAEPVVLLTPQFYQILPGSGVARQSE